MEPFDGSPKKSIIIMDNCSIHHVSGVKQLLEDAGILLFYLPPYSPDLNPFEEAFSSVKYYLKDYDDVLQAVADPLPIARHGYHILYGYFKNYFQNYY
uniref:Tc1-like transposase DDE domain-containing protein n=1 Tax=Amphimedon queenslandica TaxID=400682 RepID=A0A1X7VTI6_AMPQE